MLGASCRVDGENLSSAENRLSECAAGRRFRPQLGKGNIGLLWQNFTVCLPFLYRIRGFVAVKFFSIRRVREWGVVDPSGRQDPRKHWEFLGCAPSGSRPQAVRGDGSIWNAEV